MLTSIDLLRDSEHRITDRRIVLSVATTILEKQTRPLVAFDSPGDETLCLYAIDGYYVVEYLGNPEASRTIVWTTQAHAELDRKYANVRGGWCGDPTCEIAIRDRFLERTDPIWADCDRADIRVVDTEGERWLLAIRDAFVERLDEIDGWSDATISGRSLGPGREDPLVVAHEIVEYAAYDGLVSPYDVIAAWSACSGFDCDDEIDETGYTTDTQWGSTTIRRMRSALYEIGLAYVGPLYDRLLEIRTETASLPA